MPVKNIHLSQKSENRSHLSGWDSTSHGISVFIRSVSFNKSNTKKAIQTLQRYIPYSFDKTYRFLFITVQCYTFSESEKIEYNTHSVEFSRQPV